MTAATLPNSKIQMYSDIKECLLKEGLHRIENDDYIIKEPVVVAKEKGIEVKYGDLSNIINRSAWNIDANAEISGLIGYDHQSEDYYVAISSKDSENRKRFTLAHELWHYFLHNKELQSEPIIETNLSYLFRTTEKGTELEREANAFAAEYLMPEAQVRKAYEQYKYISLLASYFNVSELAMAFRLENLWIGQ